jgi:RNA polymerase sigma factor (TIGR02999 family)
VGAYDKTADTTQLLLAWAGGDARALDALAPRIYQELHRLAVDFMKREREEPILQATALVHEVYLKLIDVQNVALEGKAHFYAICAQMMRRILVDAARKSCVPARRQTGTDSPGRCGSFEAEPG